MIYHFNPDVLSLPDVLRVAQTPIFQLQQKVKSNDTRRLHLRFLYYASLTQAQRQEFKNQKKLLQKRLNKPE